jgi:MFS superfamily sulfate permease-like transporter
MGLDGRLDHGRSRDSEGDGLCDDRRSASAGRSLHTTQTAVNRFAGARTQLAELVTATVALLTMLYLAPLIALMPQATLAAVVIVYSIVLIKPADLWLILQIRRTEFFGRWSL